MTVNVDDTRRCPVSAHCESCDTAADLAVVTWDTPVGVLCCTICGTCVGKARLPRWSLPAAARRVLEHCGHLDIDLEKMAAARQAEREHYGGG